MKYLKILAAFAAVILQGCSADRQGEISVACPEAVKFLPAFPSFEDKEAFFNDSLLYMRGRALRDTERGQQAIADADISLESYLSRFGEVMGVELSEQATPATAGYINATCKFAAGMIKAAKSDFTRQRPFSYFGEPSSIPEVEEEYGLYTSYPSGHSLIAWIVALSLSSIDEEHEYDILRLGYELGQSRIIAGFHYQSDVDAGRLAAGVAYARLVSDPEYIRLMRLAAKELEKQEAE